MFLVQTPGKVLALPMEKRAVQHVQSLRRNGRVHSLRGARIGVGPIKQRQERVLVLPLHHQIHTALIMVIDRLERRVLTKTPGIDIGKWMLSTR